TEHVELRDQRRMARRARRIRSRKLQALDATAIVKLQRGAGAICPRQQLDVPQLVIIARDTLWDRELSGAILNGLLAGIAIAIFLDVCPSDDSAHKGVTRVDAGHRNHGAIPGLTRRMGKIA